MPKHFLITYTPLKGHKDPDFRELTYGDSGQRGRKFKKDISQGSYLFFHTKIGSSKYITCYIVVDRIVSGKDARKDNSITCDAQYDDWVFIGDKVKSKRLRKPIPLNKCLAEKLSLNIDFTKLDNNTKTELQVIGSATRQPRELLQQDVDTLLKKINNYQDNVKVENSEDVQYHLHFYDEGEDIIPIDEIHKIKESEIQKLIRKTPSIVEQGARVIDYEKVLSDGDRLDLLLEASDGSLIVGELKGPNCLTDAIATQIASYAHDIEKEYPNKKVRKMIICDGKVSPKLQKACQTLSIEVVVYGVKLDCFKLT
ncbi:PDDEXK family nuclease [Anaeromicrobium sediminis]|uniref:DUF91 domain-containing protein n=1 Tax=Anaeromicrobium sediminis TaxID=1478221 RepID=A0A267MCS6_9FIRM|nr:endonuclease NucS domain-containing protein [Anaeromicrobium sediminis]PAB57394.1 hypothetical protein CCE28_19050 [Anaeromicrobium sediminis]